jgi:hypothetical protein
MIDMPSDAPDATAEKTSGSRRYANPQGERSTT